MAFDVNNFVIDRPVRGVMLDSSTGEVLWSVNQLTEPSLTITSESTDAVDALGAPIMTFERGKSAEFSASNSLFDLGLAAAQFGESKSIASADNKYKVPIFEELTVGTAGATATLAHKPAGTGAEGIPFIYKLNGDSTLAQKFSYAVAAGDDAFTYTENTLTFPTSLATGDKVLVIYEYEADGTDGAGAVSVMNSAKNFPKAGKFILEVLGCNVCDASTLYYAYIIFPQAKMLSDVELSFTTEAKHGFKMKAMQEYCDHEKKLFQIVVPEA